MMIRKSRTQFTAPGTIRILSPLTQCPGCVRSQKRCIGVLHLISTLYLVRMVVHLPLEDGREDTPNVIGCDETVGDIKKKLKLLDWEYTAVEGETVGQISQHQKLF